MSHTHETEEIRLLIALTKQFQEMNQKGKFLELIGHHVHGSGLYIDAR